MCQLPLAPCWPELVRGQSMSQRWRGSASNRESTSDHMTKSSVAQSRMSNMLPRLRHIAPSMLASNQARRAKFARVVFFVPKEQVRPMDILQALRSERDRLTAAIEALEGNRRGRPTATSVGGRRRRRTLSATAKRRISEAAKKRWAAAKKAGRNSL